MQVPPRFAARAIAPAIALLLLVACSQPAPPPSTAASPPPATPAAPSPEISTEPKPTQAQDAPADLGVTTNAPRLTIREEPRAGAPVKEQLKMANPLDQQLVLLVDHARGEGSSAWYRVWLPERPNGSRGWVPARVVKEVALHERVEIDLSKYSLEWFKNGKLVDRFEVGVGQPQWPTPIGTFYVWAKVPQPGSTGAYGVYALGLSGFSPVLSDWPGGGRAAMHGTAAAWNKGRKVSHGCIRIFNPDMERLKHLPMGTPVIITK